MCVGGWVCMDVSVCVHVVGGGGGAVQMLIEL